VEMWLFSRNFWINFIIIEIFLGWN
jgi:hypothetical protein